MKALIIIALLCTPYASTLAMGGSRKTKLIFFVGVIIATVYAILAM